VNDVPPKDRDIAMVFQNYALYPHMTVYHNMAFGLKLRKYPKVEIDQRVRDAADILGITDYLDRKPKALSGGQRQRVAVGRAIVRQPKAFLFDEPLSNLDAKMRVQMRMEISKLHQQLESTMIYVTHDQVEAMTMGDRIAVMKDGVLQQVDAPLNIYDAPANSFVAGFIGSPPMNFFKGTLLREFGGVNFQAHEGFSIVLDPTQYDLLKDIGQETIVLGIRPEHIQVADATNETPKEASFHAGVDLVEPMGAEVHLHLVVGETQFIARIDDHGRVPKGDSITVILDRSKIKFFRDNKEGACI
jgi:multiple sugar transport system ATP-binding protein